jgi:nitrate reductase alpha subunit
VVQPLGTAQAEDAIYDSESMRRFAIRRRQGHIFHAWESYQFRSKTSHQALIPSPIKVTQLVGDYGHLHWNYGHYEPNGVDRDTRVSVARV